MDRAADTARLAAVRRRVSALDGGGWMLSADGEATMLDARGRDGSLVTIARFERLVSLEEMEIAAAAPDDLRFLLSLVDRAIRFASRAAGSPAGRADERESGLPASRDDCRVGTRQPDHTTEAAMLCGDAAFKRFLLDCHGLEPPASDERAAQRLRGLLGVTSRREINQSDAARERWLALREDFRKWKGMAA